MAHSVLRMISKKVYLFRRKGGTMYKKLGLFLVICALSLGFSTLSHAYIPIDFSEAAIDPTPPDSDPGDYDHTYTLSTSWGDIAFNGRIWRKLNKEKFSDHTPGEDGFFLKNTREKAIVWMNFAFDVESLEFYWLGVEDFKMRFAAFDIDGKRLIKKWRKGQDEWRGPICMGPFPDPIRSLKFWSVNANGRRRGNKVAIDDMKIYPVPEPMSLMLVGAGLLAFAGIRRKKR